MPGLLLQRIPPKAIQLGFWGIFGVVAVMAFLGSTMTGYRYSADLSAVTYSSLLQGFAVLAVAAALGLVLRKHILDVEIRSVEDRTLEALSRDLGWHGLQWSQDLEERIRTLPPTMSVASPQTPTPPPQSQFLAPPPAEFPPPASAPAGSPSEEPEALDQELDSLLDAIMDEDQQPRGSASKAAQAEVEELEQMQIVTQAPPPAPPAEVVGPVAQVEAATFIAAVDERHGLLARRRELYTLMSGPLAQMGILVGVSYYALPIATGALAQNAFLNTALLFMSTYGAVVALAHTALSALRVVAA